MVRAREGLGLIFLSEAAVLHEANPNPNPIPNPNPNPNPYLRSAEAAALPEPSMPTSGASFAPPSASDSGR